jgi:hypothetical protein
VNDLLAGTCFSLAAWFPMEGMGVENVALTEVPDYTWYAGCFGTASGNLMGYWDRSGFPHFYTGPTNGGKAPLNSNGANEGIRSLFASKAGLDGRPSDQSGHIDDYWNSYQSDVIYSYESTEPDPYQIAGRPEHEPDCIGDFIGLSQNKWTNMNQECDGNIDAFSFVFWETNGRRRVNFVPPAQDGKPVRDIPSGLKAWTKYRGFQAEVYSQLTDFNPNIPEGEGFGFEDLKAEIDAGYPVLLFMQRFDQKFRSLPGMELANPNIHGMLAYGYYIKSDGKRFVRYKNSWGSSGMHSLREWNADDWEANLPIRGVIGYRPLPQIMEFEHSGSNLTLRWHGPSASLTNFAGRTSTNLHWYVVERSTPDEPGTFTQVSEPTSQREHTVTDANPAGFYRIKLLTTEQDLQDNPAE